jgi:hypothetical protein
VLSGADGIEVGRELSDAARATALAMVLATRSVPARVEGVGTMAVLTPTGDEPLDWPRRRREVVDLARAHGFTHVALDIGARDEEGGAERVEQHSRE